MQSSLFFWSPTRQRLRSPWGNKAYSESILEILDLPGLSRTCRLTAGRTSRTSVSSERAQWLSNNGVCRDTSASRTQVHSHPFQGAAVTVWYGLYCSPYGCVAMTHQSLILGTEQPHAWHTLSQVYLAHQQWFTSLGTQSTFVHKEQIALCLCPLCSFSVFVELHFKRCRVNSSLSYLYNTLKQYGFNKGKFLNI